MSPPRALPQSILFACNYNIVRSVMATAIFRLRFGRNLWTDSCGVRRGADPDPFVAAVLDEIGVDVSRHRPKDFSELEDTNFDMIISLTPEAHHRALEFTRTMAVDVEYWPTQDPTQAQGSRDQRLEEYRAVRDALTRRIEARFERPVIG